MNKLYTKKIDLICITTYLENTLLKLYVIRLIGLNR